jgi:RNA polymerase sigma-70 factor (ECF subfamily)
MSPEAPKQFVQLLARHERSVYAFIVSLVPNWADADEILQETSVKLWENFDRFQPGSDFGAWARTIARFQVMTYRKQAARQKRRQFSDAFLEIVAARIDEQSLDSVDERRRAALSQCLERVDTKTRTMLDKYYSIDGPRQLASQLGRTIESVRVTLFRVRRLLHECIERRMATTTIL